MQRVNLYNQPIVAESVGALPITLNVVSTRTMEYVAGGVPGTTQKMETYILLSSLPEELRVRVIDAVNVQMAGQ